MSIALPRTYIPLYGPPVLGSSLILLPLDEEENSSLVAFMAVLASGKMVALNESNAVTPTTSNTIKITIDRAQRSLAHDELASRFFEQQPRRSDLVLEPVLDVDDEPDVPTRWSILLRAHLGDTLLTSFSRGRGAPLLFGDEGRASWGSRTFGL